MTKATLFGFAKKIGMTRIFLDGKAVSVTALQLGDNTLLQQKTVEKDGYVAVQLAAFPKNTKSTKPRVGHIAKHKASEIDAKDFYCLGEFEGTLGEGKTSLSIEDITLNTELKITGQTKGRGFAGVVKRWDFAGQPASHGHDHERAPGSIGSRWPQNTRRGIKMAGRYGNDQLTLRGLKIVALDPEQKLFFVAGSVPGPNSGYLKFQSIIK
jgi:large subunit ribosomal protein L3